MGLCGCEPYHQRPAAGAHFREDSIYRAVLPASYLCPLDRIGLAAGRSLPEVIEDAITQYCLSGGVDPEVSRIG